MIEKRWVALGAAALTFVATVGASAPVHVTQPPSMNAPADVYFGRLKMSVVRVRYSIQQLGARLHANPADAPDVLHLLTFTDEAYQQWAQRYPKDSWLSQTGLALGKVYAGIADPAAHARALAAYRICGQVDHHTKFGHDCRIALAQGAPMPAVATAANSPAPATPAASASAVPTPSPVPAPTDSPTPVPSPSPTPAPRKRGLFGL